MPDIRDLINSAKKNWGIAQAHAAAKSLSDEDVENYKNFPPPQRHDGLNRPTESDPLNLWFRVKKTPERREQDARESAYLRSLIQSGNEEPDTQERLKRVDSTTEPMWDHGPLRVLNRAAVYVDALPASVYSAGEVLGNAIAPGMYPDAIDNLEYNVNTLTLGGYGDAKRNIFGYPGATGSYWDDEQNRIFTLGNENPDYTIDRLQRVQEINDRFENKRREKMPYGTDFLDRSGVPEGLPRTAWGGLLDTATDPWYPKRWLKAGVNLVKRSPKVTKEFVSQLGPDLLVGGGPDVLMDLLMKSADAIIPEEEPTGGGW